MILYKLIFNFSTERPKNSLKLPNMYQFRLNAIECSNFTFKFRQQHRLLTTILKHNCFLYIVEYVFNLPSYIVQNVVAITIQSYE